MGLSTSYCFPLCVKRVIVGRTRAPLLVLGPTGGLLVGFYI